MRSPLGGHSDRVEMCSRALLGDLLPIAHELRVVRKPVVVADVVTEELLRRRDLRIPGRRKQGNERERYHSTNATEEIETHEGDSGELWR